MTTTIKIGSVGFGAVNGYPPSRWRLAGKRNGSWELVNVKHPSAAKAFPPQFVAWDVVERIMSDPR